MESEEIISFSAITDYPKDYLFCYKSEKTSLYSLISQSLRYSPISTLNDPIENTLQTFFLDQDTRFQKDKIPGYVQLLKDVTKKYCENFVKVLCFTLGNDPEPDTFISQSHQGYMRFSMWSQYADNGKGTCIVLNKKKLDKIFEDQLKTENIFGKSGQINYTESYEHGMAFRFSYDEIQSLKTGNNILQPKIIKYFNEYFFKKRKDWSNESEYRYLLISDRIEKLDISNSVAGIVYGFDTSKEFESSINSLEPLKRVPKVKIILQGYHAYIKGF